jgi:hypothetical protein
MLASMTQSTPPLGRWATTAIGLEVFMSVGAIGGGIALMARIARGNPSAPTSRFTLTA